MRKFYYKFQWFGVILLPTILIFGPSLLGITQWNNPMFPLITGLALFGLLFAIAITTIKTSQHNGRKYLSVRIATLLEAAYVCVFTLLLTSGSSSADNSNSAIVSILLDRGLTGSSAWMANDIARSTLFILMFFFLVTVLVSATRERVELTHRTISRYELLPFLEDDEDSKNDEDNANKSSKSDLE